MQQLNKDIILRLRQMAQQGDGAAAMVRELKKRLSGDAQIVTVMDYFRAAFCLNLVEVKPLAALSRNETREIEDESLLDELVGSSIAQHRSQWNLDDASEAL